MYRTVAVLAAIGVAIAGCTAIGDETTTCQKFIGMSQDARGATIAKVLKARNGLNSSTSDVGRGVARTLDFCASPGNQDKAVKDATP
jgi:acid stress chaperone HdeA